MTDDFLAGALALAAYLYNTSADQFVTDFAPGCHPSYRAEKAATFVHSHAQALGMLDDERFARIVGFAEERHGKYARERIAFMRAERVKP